MRRALFALPLTALLAACGSATTSVTSDRTPVTSQPTPAQATTGQLYEVKFQNIGTSTATSSVSPIPVGVTPQSLQDIDDSKLVFRPLTVDTFVVAGTRYIRAIYNVINNTGADIQHLTFVPIDTDVDPGATTPPTVDPTVGSTYFKSLKRFDGSDTSSRATDLTPVTGRTYSAASQRDVTDPEATPYTALNTSTLHPGAPTGLIVAGRATSGWRNGTTLPDGASTAITFAVAVANSNAQTDPFTFSLMVAEGDDVTPPTVTGISPNQGSTLGGTAVTVMGSNFSSRTTVKFGGVAATSVVISSPISLTAVIPAAAAAGPVDVVASTGGDSSPISAADQFTYVSTPTVASVTPNGGLITGGTMVSVTGTGFSPGMTVKFGGMTASNVNVISSTSLTATSPAMSTTGNVDVVVSNANGSSATSAADQFGYLSISEFNVPTADSQPLGITSGADGNLWFAEFNATQVGRITSAGVIQEFPTSGSSAYGIGITRGPGTDPNVWMAGYTAVGRVAQSGTVTDIATPSSTNGPNYIAAGPDGNLWFTDYGANRINRLTPQGTVTRFAVPNGSNDLQEVTGGPDGNVWFTEKTSNKIARITPAGAITEFAIPTVGSQPQGITKGPDGNLWFTESAGNKIGRITPAGVITEFSIPTGNSNPQGITSGADGNVWFVEQGGNKIARITPSGRIIEFSVPTASSGLAGITSGPDGNLWFTELTGNKIGVLKR
ncbi:virginiamycin B lyase family protein [Deinococcus ruber]|uniref:IPT/TIG domain-containing protein n=1 Tax=Deinococcus ruber TaxID=1848197 RepID=A0A918CJD1_9DEIO|nr:IPT/TIG domain-containing protein [Deinococcus ruber]GGR27608.1 hypothetical protein GCM10008957_43710 [Deinococcus ruber]